MTEDTKSQKTNKQISSLDVDNGEEQQPHSNPEYWLLYVSHFLQTFGDRLWQFAVPILFTLLFPDTIFPQAVFAFCTFSAIIVCMPSFGSWVDQVNRLNVLFYSITIQNSAIVISCGLLFWLAYLIGPTNKPLNLSDTNVITIFLGLIFTSMVGYVCGKGATLALEKDWVVVFASHDHATLTNVNARMKRIDLFCKIVAPALFGFQVQFVGHSPMTKIVYGSLSVLIWNVVGFFLEYYTIRRLYYQQETLLGDLSNKKQKSKQNMCLQLYHGWRFWLRSNMFFASLAYAAMYVNVLSGGPLVTAYLRFSGLSFLALGVAKGIGALFGIVGTYVNQLLMRAGWNMPQIALLMHWLFTVLLLIAVASFITKTETGSFIALPWNVKPAYLILCSMVLTRLPLWGFDVAENQMMQTRIQPQIRAYVSGVQMAVCNIFYVVLMIMGMIFSRVGEFGILVYFAISVIFVGSVLYTLWYAVPKSFAKDHYRNIFLPISNIKKNNTAVLQNFDLVSNMKAKASELSKKT